MYYKLFVHQILVKKRSLAKNHQAMATQYMLQHKEYIGSEG